MCIPEIQNNEYQLIVRGVDMYVFQVEFRYKDT